MRFASAIGGFWASLVVLVVAWGEVRGGESTAPIRPPAVPLITHDPYFSVWSTDDHLTDGPTKHWTGSRQAMAGLVRIDGKPFRIIGAQPAVAPAMKQIDLQVLPTRTIYRFEAGGIRLTLTFLSPLLPHDLDVMARPVTYMSWEAESTDGSSHSVDVYLDVAAEIAVDKSDQPVVWSRSRLQGLQVLRVGSKEQAILSRAGDNLRIDWGWFYLAVPRTSRARTAIAVDRDSRESFLRTGQLPANDELRMPRGANDRTPVLACALDLGPVGKAPVRRHVLLAYDDLFSIEYFQRKLRPYWRRKGMETDELLRAAAQDYESLQTRCQAFDRELMADLAHAGGPAYARLAALAFRQCIAAHKLVADLDGTPLFFSKENFSNGCIDTVDVTYPSAPFFLLFNPTLLKGQLTPILDYARSARWPHPFAPHDLGTYPLANGQVYGGGEKTERDQMPVEECGNMLIMIAALAHIEGNAIYAQRYWPVLTRWAEYLQQKGLDPENQLCTDDFAGHLAHNTNLSLKAIVALAGFAEVCKLAGKPEDGARFRRSAEQMAARWEPMAADGDHYRLAFDRPGTWSQKYNLVWDSLLGLNLFPAAIRQKEVKFYLAHQNRFGLPLDNRSTYTKLDWIVWTATLAESGDDFRAFIQPLEDFVNHSPSRVPLTDWYWTTDGKQQGFQARSVVGGVYIKMLADSNLWKKWAGRAAQ